MASLPEDSSATSSAPIGGGHPGPAKALEEDEFIFAGIEGDQFTDKTKLGVYEDKTNLIRSEFQMGVAVMHVLYLDTHWRVSG
jgi:hypothetical protein